MWAPPLLLELSQRSKSKDQLELEERRGVQFPLGANTHKLNAHRCPPDNLTVILATVHLTVHLSKGPRVSVNVCVKERMPFVLLFSLQNTTEL